MKIGIVGLGRVGKIHLTNLIQYFPDVDVVIVSDPVPETHAFARKLGVSQVVVDAEDVLRNPEVEAVIICSPTPFHIPYVKLAASHGKHIFCEKPLDVELESIRAAQRVVEEHGVKLMVGFNRRFDDNFAKVRELVLSGKIGEPHLLRITSRDPAPPPLEYIKVSGGIFLDMSIHDFDMARFIVGSEVVEVYVKGAALVNPEIATLGDIDTALVVLTFANGAIGVIDNSRQAVYGYDQRLEILGSEGMAKAENRHENDVVFAGREGVSGSLPLYFFLERYEKAFRACLGAFLASIQNNTPSPVDAHDGLMATAIGKAARVSLIEQRPVKMNEILP
jgi:myo-inositol 2-dehydrogenase/D-chiro-inositol 1-dehydrogenase